MTRVQLSNPNTSHSTTKYEVEARPKAGGKWYLNQVLHDLELAKKGRDAVNATGHLEGRIIVVSETRRIAP